MTYTVYILYSKESNKFYTGYTSLSMENRLKRHLSDHKGFTGKHYDWYVVFTKEFDNKSQALKFEKKIKKRGANRFLNDNDYRVTPKA